MNISNIIKAWKTSIIGLFCLIIAGAYALVGDNAGWEITAIFLVVGVVLLLSPDKAKEAIDKVVNRAGDDIEIKK